MKFVSLLKLTKTLSNVEQEAMDTNEGMDDQQAIAADDEIGLATQMVRTQSQMTFQIDEFQSMLCEGNEVGIFNVIVNSNTLISLSIKVPTEALFIDWRDSSTFTYRTGNMDCIGRNNPNADCRNWRGCINMSECNLAHRMIAQGFSLLNTVSFLLEKFTL